jgi:hypothetical protein
MPKGVYRRPSVRERFWAKVSRTDGCWLWTGRLFGGGYGSLRVDGRRLLAHRVSWMLHFGEAPDDMCVCHRCDVRHCINPEHLFLGTHQANTLDAVAKGRFPKGETQGRSKLTESDVRDIRLRYESGVIGGNALAREYGLAQRTVWDVIQRKHWKHVA